MTAKQKRLHKLGNAIRRVKGGFFTPPQKKAKAHMERRLAICRAHGDV